MAKNIKVMIGVPCHDQVQASFAQSLANLVEYTTRKKYEVVIQFYEGTIVATARQKILEQAVAQDVDYLYFVDSDMIMHPKVIEHLIRCDVDIVSTMFFKRVYPYQPCFYSGVTVDENNIATLEVPLVWGEYGLYECDGTGLASTLISKRVLTRLVDEEPFIHPSAGIGEDIAFCLNARNAGFKVYVDTRMETGHIGRIVVTEKTYKEVQGNE